MSDIPSGGRRAKRQEALDLYTTTDLSAETIAEQIGVSRSTLYNWVNAAGLSGSRREAPLSDTARLAETLEEFRTTLAGRPLEQTEIEDRWQAALDTMTGTRDTLNHLVEEQEGRWQQWNTACQSVQAEVALNRETTMREVGELRREIDEVRALLNANSAILGRVQGVLDAMVAMGTRNIENIQRALRPAADE